MKRRYLLSSFLTFALLFMFTSSALAQNLRPDDTVFLKPRVGFSNYFGDRDDTPLDFDDWRVDGKFPYSAAVELGYQFTPGFSVSAAYQIADYPTIRLADNGAERNGYVVGPQNNNPGGRAVILDTDANPELDNLNSDEYGEYYTRRHTAQLLLRYMFGANSWALSPFITLGGHGTVGYSDYTVWPNDDPDDFEENDDGQLEHEPYGFGPTVGLGLNWAFNDQVSLSLEGLSNVVFPDDVADGFTYSGDDDEDDPLGQGAGDDEDAFGGPDVLSSVTLGLKYNFSGAFTPVEIMSLDCPDELEVGEEATFTASVNDDVATPPISYDWDFGDGTMGDGLLASHSFNQSGTYTVEFTASNDGSTRTETCVVDVEEPPTEAQIVSLNASPRSFELCEPTTVEFSSNVQGENVDYNWDFGNGQTSTDQEPEVTYTEPGTYTVTLRVSNEVGSDTRTITVRARECGPPDICQEVTELNPVFFDENSSQLSSEARAALRENLEILEQCPNICTRIEGFAAPGERDPDALSEARAQAVADFYEDNGIDTDDIRVVGMGQVGGTTSKKQGTSQFRRADSIPVDCEDLGDMDVDDLDRDADDFDDDDM